jgi:iron complex outermembrane recepter protein
MSAVQPNREIFMSYSLGDSPPRSVRTVSEFVRSLSKPLIGGFCALWLVALPLQAADTAASDADTTQLQEVVVTGSRIAVPANISATSPVQIVTSQEVQLEGQTDTINIINRLPQIMISPGVDLGNNSQPLSAPGGISTADLRGLGP